MHDNIRTSRAQHNKLYHRSINSHHLNTTLWPFPRSVRPSSSTPCVRPFTEASLKQKFYSALKWYEMRFGFGRTWNLFFSSYLSFPAEMGLGSFYHHETTFERWSMRLHGLRQKIFVTKWDTLHEAKTHSLYSRTAQDRQQSSTTCDFRLHSFILRYASSV